MYNIGCRCHSFPICRWRVDCRPVPRGHVSSEAAAAATCADRNWLTTRSITAAATRRVSSTGNWHGWRRRRRGRRLAWRWRPGGDHPHRCLVAQRDEGGCRSTQRHGMMRPHVASSCRHGYTPGLRLTPPSPPLLLLLVTSVTSIPCASAKASSTSGEPFYIVTKVDYRWLSVDFVFCSLRTRPVVYFALCVASASCSLYCPEPYIAIRWGTRRKLENLPFDDLHCNPNPNPTTKQHVIVNVQLIC